MNNNFNGHGPPDEFKYRSRGQAENFDQVPDHLNLQYPNDPENDDNGQMVEEDVGPMSLTINTKEFNEHYQNQGLLQGQMDNEALQFQLDEQAADQTIKQEFLSKRTQKIPSNKQSSTKKMMGDDSP